MDLGEQANEALFVLHQELGVAMNEDQQRVARLMWLEGFKAGMAATSALANQSFAQLAENLT